MTTQPDAADPVDVLIAEDDALLRSSLRSLLEKEGFHCAEAEDGRAAVEVARKSAPRFAPLDLAMPRLDGFAVARALRSDARTKGIHMHCLTGRVDSDARSQAADAGFETFWTKPVDLSRLLLLVQGQGKKPEVRRASGLSLEEARSLLDEWQNQGCVELTASYHEGRGFAVRGVRPPAGS